MNDGFAQRRDRRSVARVDIKAAERNDTAERIEPTEKEGLA